MSRKMLSFVGLIFVVALFVTVGCGKKEKEPPAEKTEAGKKVKEVAKPSAKMTDDIYVEVVAHTSYLTAKYGQKVKGKDTVTAAKLAAELGEEMQKIYKKFGVTEDAYSDYANQMTEHATKNPEHYGKLMERIAKRAKELQKAGK